MSKRTRNSLVSLLALLAPALCRAQGYTISTAAGGASTYYFAGTGDGGKATSAGLANPCYDVAVDAAGNLYIVAGSLVRKVTAAGIISTVAGGGSSVGDFVPAIQADLSPTAIAVDSAGNLYIADSAFGASRVRKVNSKGIISTVAGGAACCALGDGGPAITAYIAVPWGLAVDTLGNLYIAQVDGASRNLVRKVTTDGTISTVAGGGTSTADSGAATSASLSRPLGVAVDTAGNLYITEAGGNRVRRVTRAGAISTAAAIDSPWHVAVDASGNLYVTQSSGAAVRSIAPAGAVATIAGTGAHGFSGDGGSATAAQLDRPAGIAIGAKGVIYVADATTAIARVRLLTPIAPLTTPPTIQTAVSAGAFGAFTAIAPGTWIRHGAPAMPSRPKSKSDSGRVAGWPRPSRGGVRPRAQGDHKIRRPSCNDRPARRIHGLGAGGTGVWSGSQPSKEAATRRISGLPRNERTPV